MISAIGKQNLKQKVKQWKWRGITKNWQENMENLQM